MELMHHYSSYVSTVLVRRPEPKYWNEVVPNDALQHPFLLHGLLAVSALSLACLRPAKIDEYLIFSDKHQGLALVGFRKALSGPIEEDIGNALFAQASITSVSSIARSCIVAGAKSPPRAIDIEEVTELFILTRGVRDVKRATNDIVVTGPLAFMFRGHSPMSPQASEGSKIPLPDCVRSELSRLEEMLQEQCEPDELEHCSAALHELTQIYRNVQHFARISAVDTGHVLRWLTKVPLGFVRLMERRHQPALVVLAYFAAAMVAVRTVWFTKDWGVHALQGVRMALGESMRHWLEWPEEQVRTDLAALRGNTFYTLEEQFESVHCQ